MRAFFAATCSLFAAGLIKTAVGLKCSSTCAACWKDDDPNGVDIKISCPGGYCGEKCPQGYHDMHCAETGRCYCVWLWGWDCSERGPCACPSGNRDCGDYTCIE